VLIVTTNDLPGWEIQRVCGEVFGLTVRSRVVFAQIGAGFKSIFGGELRPSRSPTLRSTPPVSWDTAQEARPGG
jgi:uncharacterized protein YbjQ (UPF0145 family)